MNRRNTIGRMCYGQLRESHSKSGSPCILFLCSDPVRILKRLVGELFEKDLDVQSRLTAIENTLGIAMDDPPSGNASRVSGGAGMAGMQPSLRSLGGRLVVGGGVLWSQSDEESLESMIQSGVKLGTAMTLQARGKFREGKDFILSDIAVDKDNVEKFALEKVLYSSEILPGIRFMFAPFGAKGNDITYTLNPFAGRGLTSATSEGNPLLHDRGAGSVLAGSVSLPRLWVSGAYIGKESETEQETALFQILCAPFKSLSLGLTLSEAQADTSHFKYLRDSLLSSVIKSYSSSSERPDKLDVEAAGSFALSLGNYAIHGWSVRHLRSDANNLTWNLSLGDKLPTGPMQSRWVISVGKSFPQSRSSDILSPDAFELGSEFDVGAGLHFHPGLVGIKDRSQWTILAGAKTVWDF